MGIKDNFQQALRELTGTEKEETGENTGHDKSIDAIRNAVKAGDTSEFDSINEIDMRAQSAADQYDKQQRAFAENFGIEEDPEEQEDQFIGIENSDQPVSMGSNGIDDLVSKYNSANSDSSAKSGYSFNEQDTTAYQNTTSSRSTGYGSSGYPNMSGYQQRSSYDQSSYRQQDNSHRAGPENTGAGREPSGAFSAARYSHNNSDDNEITVISKNTVIDGNIRSFANMSVDGNIKGNIETTKDIRLNGKVVGNIACNNAEMHTSQIQGNIQMKGNAIMGRDTLLIGDLTSTYANVNGKIKGNLDITGKAELKSDAVVFGDISASTITVNDGAIIQGYVSTTFLNKEESKNIFPDTITIGE